MVRIALGFWLSAVVVAVAAAPSINTQRTQGEGSAPSPALSQAPPVQFRYADGLLSGQAEQAPVADVLDALGTATGAEIVQRYAAQEDDRLSFAFSERPFREAIKEVLAGFNYVIGRPGQPGGVPAVLLLGREAAPPPVAEQTEQTPPSDPAPQPQAAKRSPWDLDAFWPLSTPMLEAAGPADGADQSLSEEEREALEAELRSERIDRAIAALESSHRNLHAEALESMRGLDDPRVAAAMRAGALGEMESSLDTGFYARALWQHAADLQFRDAASVSALQDLAASDDRGVREVASEALADRSRYLERQANQE